MTIWIVFLIVLLKKFDSPGEVGRRKSFIFSMNLNPSSVYFQSMREWHESNRWVQPVQLKLISIPSDDIEPDRTEGESV